MADLNQYRRGPLGNDRDVIIAIQEIADKLNEVIARTNTLSNMRLVWTDIDPASLPTTLEGYGITNAAHLHHTHPISDVDGLQTELDDLAAAIGGGGTPVTWDTLSGKPSTFPPSPHNHDDRYYTKAEDNALLAGKAALIHNHNDLYYTKAQSDTQLSGKVNRVGGDYMQGFDLNPTSLDFDLEVPDGFRLNIHGGTWDVNAALVIGGHVEIYE